MAAVQDVGAIPGIICPHKLGMEPSRIRLAESASISNVNARGCEGRPCPMYRYTNIQKTDEGETYTAACGYQFDAMQQQNQRAEEIRRLGVLIELIGAVNVDTTARLIQLKTPVAAAPKEA